MRQQGSTVVIIREACVLDVYHEYQAVVPRSTDDVTPRPNPADVFNAADWARLVDY